ncbi:hypothetical protein IMSAG192_00722 [Muribaculaceae bacterium]|nr:hypothetical protein IMSAG192_00722 [Muribaculaceae bacterium]
MAELMAYRADTIELLIGRSAVKFGRAGIASERYAVEREIHDCGCMWPKQSGIVSGMIRASSGENKVDHVDLAVAVGIIQCVVHLLIGGTKSSADKSLGSGALIGIMLGIIYLHRPYHIKLRVKLAVGVFIIIISHRAGTFHLRRNESV